MSASRLARRSIPAEAVVSYAGSGCLERLTILIFMVLSEGAKVIKILISGF
jgi:hypothetical protein